MSSPPATIPVSAFPPQHAQADSLRILSQSSSRIALPCLFVVFGLLCGTWASRIPAVRDILQLSPALLSLVLLSGGLGAVFSFPFSSRLMASAGAKRTSWVSGVALLLALPMLSLAPDLPTLIAAMLAFGIACGCLDVGINAVATSQECATGRSMLSMMHAWFCVGSFGGALLGSAMAALGAVPAMHFLLVSLACALPMWLACRALPDDSSAVEAAPEKKPLGLPKGPLLLLSCLGFFGAMSEGSVADWSGLFMKDHYGVSDGMAPVALTAFSLTMLAARLAGDRIKPRFGARRLVVAGALVSAAGLFTATFCGLPLLAIAGFGMAGAGLALVFPFVFSAAGRLGTTALAGVATLSYSGSLLGPPVVGAAAHFLGLSASIGLLGLVSVAIAVVAGRTRLLD